MDTQDNSGQEQGNFKVKPLAVAIILAVIIGIVLLFENVLFSSSQSSKSSENLPDTSMALLNNLFEEEHLWKAPDTSSIPKNEEGKLIWYSRELMIHTSKYFGPGGSVSKNTNGLNCQNCHLDAGTRPYGNNLGSTAATYPKYLPRAGSVVTLAEKVNECYLRSLNGGPIDTNGKEMKAYIAYIKWLGKDVKKNDVPPGTGGIKAPKFITRAADPAQGKLVFEQYCSRCHGKDGAGQLVTDVMKDETKQQGGTATKDDHYYYPPLWGNHSFNGVATLYRLSKLAGFVQNNMPYPVDYNSRILTDEQAWDVAAYVNSCERPVKDHSMDYATDISKKPYDFPFAPYSDGFSEQQHKYGPYTEMPSAMKKGH